MAAGGLTGTGNGSSTSGKTPPSPPSTGGGFSINSNTTRQAQADGKKPGGKPEQRTSGGGQTKSVGEQNQKLQDFDAFKGRPPVGERRQGDGSDQSSKAKPSGNVQATRFDRTQSPEPRQEICADVSGTDDPPCVLVKGGEALSTEDKQMFASAFRDFIVKNDGADLSQHSADVVGFSAQDAARVRVASQFIGANLPDGWKNTRIYAGSSKDLRMSSDTAGNIEREFIRNRDPQELYIIKINMDWGDHRTNPSGLARTMIHEYLHRDDEMGMVTLVNDQHRQIDTVARAQLQDYGLGAGGCLPVGGMLWGLIPPTYPGCSE